MSNTVALQKDIVHQLGLFLTKNMPSLKQVLEEWPNPNDQLNMPSITIFTGNPKYSPFQPEVAATNPVSGDPVKIAVDVLVGEWDYSFQLDLWTANKEDRAKLFDEFFKATTLATTGFGPNGISLQLPNYYNVWCRYDMDDMTYLDDEAASQRGERRAKITLLANCPALRTIIVPSMKSIETFLTLPNNIP